MARIGLINAVDRFDPTRGHDFLSFAVPTIMGEVRRHFRDTGWSVRVPRRLKELHLSLSQGSAALSQRLGRAPTPTELAEHLSLDVDEVREGLLAGNAYQALSVDKPVHDDAEALSLADTMGEPDHEMAMVENHEALQPLLQELPQRERAILRDAVLRRADPDPDRRPRRHLPDARLPAAVADPGAAAREAHRRRLRRAAPGLPFPSQTGSNDSIRVLGRGE